MDSTVSRIIDQVAKENEIEPGFLLRILEIEEKKAHLSRRHGLFEELKELTRKTSQRMLQVSPGEDQ